MWVRTMALLATLSTVTARCGFCQGDKQPANPDEILLETDDVRLRLGADGKILSFTDRQTGRECCAHPGQRALLLIRKGGRQYQPTACTSAGGRIAVRFDPPGVTAVIQATPKKHYLVFEVESVSDPDVEEMVLTNLAVTCASYVSGMSGVAADDEFAAAVRALNLQVLGSVGGRPAVLTSRCYRQHGLVGAKVAVVGCPAGEIRSVLKEVIRNEGLPYSPLGGPWALDARENRGSYVFASVSEANAEDWIALAKKAGIEQIHFIGWEKSLGHYEPRENLFPKGLVGLKAVVDKIHAAGLKAGMHTLTGCISPHDRWVTPVPDKRLAADASFTLALPLDEKQATVLTDEKPGEFDTVWAYGARGNVLRIDEELIHFSGLAREPPYGFTDCRRGAFGTKPARHQKGARADHLYVRYGCFQPDEDSSLVDDVAETIAEVFNACGFDMIYMDGAEGMSGGWHGVAKMRKAIFEKITRPVLVEASSWGYPSWPFHSRIGAWDYPNWGLKRFIDVHCRANEQYRKSSLLPAQLGWWAIFGPDRNRDAEMPDEIEYLCAKSLAYDMPMSFQAVHPGKTPQNARQDEYLAMIGNYERLRLAGSFSESVRKRLKQEQEEFHLVETAGGAWQLIPTDYAIHKVTGLADGSQRWSVDNRYGSQPVKLRIQALYSVEAYDSGESLVLADFGSTDEFAVREAASGVSHTLEPSSEQVKTGTTSGCFRASNTTDTRRGAWARAGKAFAPEIDIDKYDALGLWIHGDGKGELLNLQLGSPRQYYHAIDEHYVEVDFRGWRYVELLLRERDADKYGDYVWPYAGHYALFRAPLVRQHVSKLSLYFNNLPPKDKVTCFLSPIKALRTKKVTLTNPSIEIGGRRIEFPASLESGGYLEFKSATDCKLYDPRGALVQEIKPQGEVPELAAGKNEVTFACEGPEGYSTRARVTVITCGEPFGDTR